MDKKVINYILESGSTDQKKMLIDILHTTAVENNNDFFTEEEIFILCTGYEKLREDFSLNEGKLKSIAAKAKGALAKFAISILPEKQINVVIDKVYKKVMSKNLGEQSKKKATKMLKQSKDFENKKQKKEYLKSFINRMDDKQKAKADETIKSVMKKSPKMKGDLAESVFLEALDTTVMSNYDANLIGLTNANNTVASQAETISSQEGEIESLTGDKKTAIIVAVSLGLALAAVIAVFVVYVVTDGFV